MKTETDTIANYMGSYMRPFCQISFDSMSVEPLNPQLAYTDYFPF